MENNTQLQDVLVKLAQMDSKLDEIADASNKTRRYFLWTLIISVVVVVLPLIGVFAALPHFLGNLDVNVINNL